MAEFPAWRGEIPLSGIKKPGVDMWWCGFIVECGWCGRDEFVRLRVVDVDTFWRLWNGPRGRKRMLSIQHGDQNDANLIKKERKRKERDKINENHTCKIKIITFNISIIPNKHCHCKFLIFTSIVYCYFAKLDMITSYTKFDFMS